VQKDQATAKLTLSDCQEKEDREGVVHSFQAAIRQGNIKACRPNQQVTIRYGGRQYLATFAEAVSFETEVMGYQVRKL
jgi:hypothetical protein